MSILTAALMSALALYLGGWFMGFWLGNFAALLMLLTAVTGVFWGLEKLLFRPKRVAAVAQLDRDMQERQQSLEARGIVHDGHDAHGEARQKLMMQPWWLDWTAGLFPVIVVVFVLRSFLFEPFKIPSGSMIPTLAIGDLILVNKYEYGLRLPVFNTKLWANKNPSRGDVIVFRYPDDPSVDYIKRVIGLPGDVIDYSNQRLTINGKLVPVGTLGQYANPETLSDTPIFSENLPGGATHRILVDPTRQLFYGGEKSFPYHQNCEYAPNHVRCTVPANHYFVMGDNRDNSADSRFWGFVPDANIAGHAFFVWMNFGDLGRIGRFH